MLEALSSLPQLVQAITLWQLVAVMLGLAIGILIGAMPGVGPLLAVVMAIPFTARMDPVSSMALLIGIYQGGSYGGAISATVVGIPGTPMAAATLLDARPMALAGRASEAVTLSTIGSSVGSTLSGFALLLIAPALAAIAIRFGPAEMFGF
jgi:putative tricarboxylic transport membrane protein